MVVSKTSSPQCHTSEKGEEKKGEMQTHPITRALLFLPESHTFSSHFSFMIRYAALSRFRFGLISLICFLMSCSSSFAQIKIVVTPRFDSTASPQYRFYPFKVQKRPRVALVLSGGGARGATQIGVLKALERNHIPIDFIAATSMGAIVGGLYASGYTPAEIESLALNTNWRSVARRRNSSADR